MRTPSARATGNRHRLGSLICLAWLVCLALAPASVRAGATPRVQVANGHLDVQESLLYDLPGLKQGETLYLYAEGTSGNFDPLVGLLKTAVDVAAAREQFRKEREKILANQPNSPEALAPLFDRYFLDWDDDSGAGYAACLKLTIPADGDYRLVLASTPLR
jgi:hypothetical protein